MGLAAAAAYAETILRCAARPVPRSLCALTTIDELKGRLKMLSFNHGTIAKSAGLLLAAGLVVVAGSLAHPALAQESKTQRKEIRTVIIEHDGKERREISVDGKDPEKMAANCPGIVTKVEAGGASGPEKKEQAKIVLCSSGTSKADAAKGLERAIADIDKNDEMDAAIKADLKAKLTARIAELRAGN